MKIFSQLVGISLANLNHINTIVSIIADMVWTCLVIFFLGVLYEGLKYYREYLMKSYKVTTYYVSDTPNGIRTNGTTGIPGRENKTDMYAI